MSTSWEVEYGDMVLVKADDSEMWVQSDYIKQLLADGWEPFAVTNMAIYHPSQIPEHDRDIYTERIWFRRRQNA